MNGRWQCLCLQHKLWLTEKEWPTEQIYAAFVSFMQLLCRGTFCNQGQKEKKHLTKTPTVEDKRMELWWICGWYLWLFTVHQNNFTAFLIKALHALTHVSTHTEGKTRILDVELQNQILLCAEEKSRVISAVCAAQALGDRCLASINIPISAQELQPTFSLST